jgi:dihydrofolate reductase
VRALHEQLNAAAGGKNVWIMGGGPVAAQFAQAGLLDQVVVTIAPVTLGSGQPLLPTELLSDSLRLESVERLGQFAQLHYSVRYSD